MANVLVIKSSLMGEGGNSNVLVDQFIDKWQADNSDDMVTIRDLSSEPVPHLNRERFMAFITPEADRNESQKSEVELSDQLIVEFLAADVLVLGVPMYNFGIPSTLKAYIDHISRVNKTFRYTAKGPVGLSGKKKVLVFGARGGFYLDTPNDSQTPYLKSILSFFGLDDVTFVIAEGLNISPEQKQKSMLQAQQDVSALFT